MPARSSEQPETRARSAALAAVLLLSACGHTEPFSTPPYGSDAPFDPSPPQRLTYNALGDRGASWLPDDGGLLYSAQQEARVDRDVCLAVMPPAGGSHRELWCDVPGGSDATDAVESPVAGPDGRLAFVSVTSSVGAPSPQMEWIAVAPPLDPRGGRMVRVFPYDPAGGTTQISARSLRWLDGGRVVYLGQNVRVYRPCGSAGCEADTLRSGAGITIVEVDAPGTPATTLPGTTTATGVAVEAGGAALLYTLAGDTRVYRYVPAAGAVEVAHDFGSAGVARDLHLVGNRLAAVVGGRVAVGADLLLGPVQYDSGGVVHVVDLDSGTEQVLELFDRLYRRPALSSDGGRLVVEGFPLILTQNPGMGVDTTVSRLGDLYLYGAP